MQYRFAVIQGASILQLHTYVSGRLRDLQYIFAVSYGTLCSLYTVHPLAGRGNLGRNPGDVLIHGPNAGGVLLQRAHPLPVHGGQLGQRHPHSSGTRSYRDGRVERHSKYINHLATLMFNIVSDKCS